MRRPSASLIVVLLVAVLNVAIAIQGVWNAPEEGNLLHLVRSDVKGYYGYLQALFIRHDLGHEPPQWEYVRQTPDGTLNKYFCGTAVMMAPWFAVGHAFALVDPAAPHDGLSIHEMRAISIGAMVYLLLGLLAMRKVLLGMGVREPVVMWTVVAFGLGTQLIQYGAIQPGWSHVYSFCAISVFLLVIHKLSVDASSRWLLVASAILGLIILIRPVNGLVLLAVPVVSGAGSISLVKSAVQHPLTFLLALVAGFAVLSIQPLLWHAQVGHWFAYGYTGEGFHWDRPQVMKVLFGFRRGLFLWTPVLLLSAVGAFALLRKDPLRGWGMLLYWVTNVYVISAWWIWYYGSGFGARVFVDHYPVLAIPFALLLNSLSPRWFLLARGYVVACCALLLFQMWQYHAGILHHECMDRAKYEFTFLRWKAEYRGALGGNYQEAPFNPNGMSIVLEESCDFEHHCPHWEGTSVRSRSGSFSGSHSARFDGSDPFGLGFNASTTVLPTGRDLFLEIGLQRFAEGRNGSRSLRAVTEIKHADGSAGFYEPFRMDPLPAKEGAWEQLEYRIPVPELEEGDRLSFYFWDPDQKALARIDDVFMRIWAVNPY